MLEEAFGDAPKASARRTASGILVTDVSAETSWLTNLREPNAGTFGNAALMAFKSGAPTWQAA